MTATTSENFFDGIDGVLTPEQAAEAMRLAEQGDTGGKPEDGGAPATTTATDDKTGEAEPAKGDEQIDETKGKADGAQPIPEDQQTADNTVILARDGKHTIDFSHLDKARQQRDTYKAEAEDAKRQLAELQAQAQARVDAGQAPTKTDNMVATAEAAIEKGADPGLFGDFSEEALAAGIAKLVQQQVAAEVGKAVAPLREQHAKDAATAHYEAIYKAHPNADSIVESAEFKAWVDAHPSAVRDAYWKLFSPETGGTAAQIVEVFDAFTKAGKEVPTAAAPDKAAARAAVAAARAEPPPSLTSIPGGRADGLSPHERMAGMGGIDMYAAMEGMSPAQIEAFLNKQL